MILILISFLDVIRYTVRTTPEPVFFGIIRHLKYKFFYYMKLIFKCDASYVQNHRRVILYLICHLLWPLPLGVARTDGGPHHRLGRASTH